MPTCPPPTERGFTLVEMLVVMTVVGLLAAILVANFGRDAGGLARQRAAQQLQAAAAAAQLAARRSGEAVALTPAALVEGAAVAKPAFPAPAAGTIVFYPDGSASGGIVTLGGAPLIEVDWLTGEVRDAG